MKRSLVATFATTVSLVPLLTLAGCPKSSTDATPAPSASASSSVVATAHADGGGISAATSASAAGLAAPGAATTYTGTYSLAPAPYYIADAKDYSHVKQAKDDPSKHVGEGALTLTVDGSGRVSGVIDSGPASPAVIDGAVVDGGEVRGNVRRKAPEDDGLTGTLVAKLGGGSGEGRLSLAEANAAIVRAGTVALKKK